MDDVISESVSRERFSVQLLGVFGGLALVLTAIGIYGVISYSVTQRTREIRVRVALGAERRDVLGMVVAQGAKLAGWGVAIGLLASLGVTRLLTRLLFEVKPTDPLTFAAVLLVLVSVTLLASFLPVRRATKVDPMVALRYE